jgi:predicted Rossmann fold nucleotide-binding protein DprA/Smf involved in DNA uptake
MITRTRRTIEERIAEAQTKLKKLEEMKNAREERAKAVKAKKNVLTKESVGVLELLTQIDAVANQHGVKVADVIKAVAKFKRTGLIIEHKSTRFDDVMGI